MKITRRRTDLTPGTIIARDGGFEIIIEPYDSYHDWYLTHDMEVTDDDLVEITTHENRTTPADLIGDYIL